MAVVESVEASNRIEGITVPERRLRALMAQAVPQLAELRDQNRVECLGKGQSAQWRRV